MARSPAGAPVEVTVEIIGARGDGIARIGTERVFLPFTAPGDRLLVALGPRRGEGYTARIVERLAEAPRAAPHCPHYGRCGGCALQHLPDDTYADVKLGFVRDALALHGIADTALRPLHRLPPGTRRRAGFKFARPPAAKAPAQVGFHGRASHDLVDMTACAVLHPNLLAIVAPVRALATTLLSPGAGGGAAATLSDHGIDLLIDVPKAPAMAELEVLAAFAEAHDLARLAWCTPDQTEPVPVALRRPVEVSFAGVAVALPYQSFLQASRDADAALADAVLRGIGDAQRIADLFAGLGTFTFALAGRASVLAVDGSAPAVAALQRAAARSGLGGRIATAHRDLERQPLVREELAPFDTVVFDPPRAGAKSQSRALALSSVRTVVAVSCNPASFARDARALIDGGYRLVDIEPFDSFIWSPHVELVAHFEKA